MKGALAAIAGVFAVLKLRQIPALPPADAFLYPLGTVVEIRFPDDRLEHWRIEDARITVDGTPEISYRRQEVGDLSGFMPERILTNLLQSLIAGPGGGQHATVWVHWTDGRSAQLMHDGTLVLL